MLKDIVGYEGLYKISHTGKVKSVRSKKWIRPYLNKDGHLKIYLWKNGKGQKYYVHRLVAIHFIPNPNNYAIVNHIDGKKKNNHVKNLEWCTQSENIQHAWDNGLFNRKNTKEYLICKIREIKPELKSGPLWKRKREDLQCYLKQLEKEVS